MADLNELDKIENQLKKLIEEREFHDKLWKEGNFVKVNSEFDEQYNKNKSKRQIENAAEQILQETQTYMAVPEHGTPYYMRNYKPGMFMGVPEHGRPFDSKVSHSRMAVREHGRPFSGNTCRTDMKIEEHGRPFDEQPRRFATTKMMANEHGKPFSRNSERMVTPDEWSFNKTQYLMASPEHGKSFFSSMTSMLSSFGTSKNMDVEENGQPNEKK
jgi:hypothetical protein